MKIESKKELKEILKLLQAEDIESNYLGYGMYQSSKFRKFIRNKSYAYLSAPNNKYAFQLYPLDPPTFNDFKYTNQHRIRKVIQILTAYIERVLIFYDKNGSQVIPG